MNFEMGQTINSIVTILSQKNVPMRVQPKTDIDLTNPEIANNQWMLQKHQHLKLEKKLFGTIGETAMFYELKDNNNNIFELQTKKYLGLVGESVEIKNCRVKAKKTFKDGKVVFILGNGTQEKYESYRRNQR